MTYSVEISKVERPATTGCPPLLGFDLVCLIDGKPHSSFFFPSAFTSMGTGQMDVGFYQCNMMAEAFLSGQSHD